MKRFAALVVGLAPLVFGLLSSDAQAWMRWGSIGGQPSTDMDGLVLLIHGCHTDCQRGKDGGTHKHSLSGGCRKKAKGCSVGRSEIPPALLSCGDEICVKAPDSSLINHSPLPSLQKDPKQSL